MISEIAATARGAGKPVWADPAKGRAFCDFAGVSAVTPNRRETEEATRIAIPRGTVPDEAAKWLMSNLGLDLALITLDSEGLYYRTADGASGMVRAHARAAYDVTGAGDMVIASAAFAVSIGMPLETALGFANFCAGLEVERIGAQPVALKEVVRRLTGEVFASSEKIADEDELISALEHRRRRGDRVVFTNGCFDIIHMGHVRYLQFARSQGDLLVVGLNSDKSVRALKEAPRPILPQAERAALLAALGCVDYVVIFDEDTPERLIKRVAPDILVKGEDWRDKGVVGREFVEGHGGKVVLAPLVQGISTTGIVKRILDAYSGGTRSE
jgi:D-beta-D-heptose 7-phosphate kinase/D-beta-D-heptose 1-phosphate adenosyltransferase